MTNGNYTQIPNILFDKFMKELNNSELKILLIIIRQTDGWFDQNTGIRKESDRITYGQFVKRTGLSKRTVSSAIDSLFRKKLINISEKSGKILNDPGMRKGGMEIYYSSKIKPMQYLHTLPDAISVNNQCKNFQKPVQKLHITKETNTKETNTKERENEIRQIKEILDRKYSNWNH